MHRYTPALLVAEALMETLCQMQAKDDYYTVWHLQDAETMLTHGFHEIVPDEGMRISPKFRVSFMRRLIRANDLINAREWATAATSLTHLADDIACAFRVRGEDEDMKYEKLFASVADLAQDMAELFRIQDERCEEEIIARLNMMIERDKQYVIDMVNKLDPDREVPFTPTVRLPR